MENFRPDLHFPDGQSLIGIPILPVLAKILVNLMSLSNAKTNTRTDETGSIRISATIEGNSLIISVYNTLPVKEYRSRLCKIDYFSIDRYRILGDLDGNNYTQMTSRNGLGLFICHSMVQFLRGTIEVKSEEGKFAEFIVRLPHLEVDEDDTVEDNEEPETCILATSPDQGEIGVPHLRMTNLHPCGRRQ